MPLSTSPPKGASRRSAQRPVYEEMIERMRAIAAGIRLGDPMSPDTAMGPIVSREQCVVTPGAARRRREAVHRPPRVRQMPKEQRRHSNRCP
ncbi:aldehyde dehydrogenase family protein [Actinomadura rubrobrunea]|uniref:aldehyde dehydrogenase family protein n=1 Tax=Actinomadura rubrobrunea TaxID=115335 RepID=UPI000A075341|nr:aldehyde dehydrogenase family protein [Actinomadura rubrobrunea]